VDCGDQLKTGNPCGHVHYLATNSGAPGQIRFISKNGKKKRRCLISSRSRSTNLAEVWEETDHVKKRRDVPHCAAFMIGKTSQYFGFKSICS
jgi:hypothetical protein